MSDKSDTDKKFASKFPWAAEQLIKQAEAAQQEAKEPPKKPTVRYPCEEGIPEFDSEEWDALDANTKRSYRAIRNFRMRQRERFRIIRARNRASERKNVVGRLTHHFKLVELMNCKRPVWLHLLNGEPAEFRDNHIKPKGKKYPCPLVRDSYKQILEDRKLHKAWCAKWGVEVGELDHLQLNAEVFPVLTPRKRKKFTDRAIELLSEINPKDITYAPAVLAYAIYDRHRNKITEKTKKILDIIKESY